MWHVVVAVLCVGLVAFWANKKRSDKKRILEEKRRHAEALLHPFIADEQLTMSRKPSDAGATTDAAATTTTATAGAGTTPAATATEVKTDGTAAATAASEKPKGEGKTEAGEVAEKEKSEEKAVRYQCVIVNPTSKYDGKYIIGVLRSPTGVETQIFISIDLHYHSQIVREYESKHIPAGHTLTVKGGGILVLDQVAKTVRTYGKSGGYGRPNRAMVERILRSSDALRGYSFDVTVTDYVRD